MLQHVVCVCLFILCEHGSITSCTVHEQKQLRNTVELFRTVMLRLPGTEKTRHTTYTRLMFQGTIHFANYDTPRTQIHLRMNLIALRVWLSAWMSKSHRDLFSLHWFWRKEKKSFKFASTFLSFPPATGNRCCREKNVESR